jgi:hypothetical protein
MQHELVKINTFVVLTLLIIDANIGFTHSLDFQYLVIR